MGLLGLKGQSWIAALPLIPLQAIFPETQREDFPGKYRSSFRENPSVKSTVFPFSRKLSGGIFQTIIGQVSGKIAVEGDHKDAPRLRADVINRS